MIDYRMLGERIKQSRLSRGLSQEELAERINASKNHVSYVETAKRSISLVMLVRIANVLEVSIEDLLSDSLEVVNAESMSFLKATHSTKKSRLMGDLYKSIDSILLDYGIN